MIILLYVAVIITELSVVSNRYGPWMDTNLVIPLGPRKCQVIFDYFLEASVKVIHLVSSMSGVF